MIPCPTLDPKGDLHMMQITPGLRDLFERYAEGFDDTDPSFRKQLVNCLGVTTLSKSLRAWMDAFAPEVLG